MEEAWILVGMMGAGKSSVGRLLAERTGRPFRDTDTLVQNRLGRPVSQIFQFYGEPTFRDHETSILRDLAPEPMVLATGGGVVLRDENWEAIRRLGTSVYLRVRPEELERRLEISRKRRPLLDAEDWPARLRALVEAREPRYLMADHVVDVGEGEIEDVVDRILTTLGVAR